MIKHLLVVSGVAALLAGTAFAETTYNLSVEITETVEETETATSTKNVFPMVSGLYGLSSKIGEENLAMGIDLKIDDAAGTALATLKMCEPGASPCNLILNTDLEFEIGEPVALKVGTPKNTIIVSMTPVSG